MDLTPNQHLAVTEAVIKFIDTWGGSGLAKKLPHGKTKFKNEAFIFYEEDKLTLFSYDNRPLYVTGFDHD